MAFRHQLPGQLDYPIRLIHGVGARGPITVWRTSRGKGGEGAMLRGIDEDGLRGSLNGGVVGAFGSKMR